MTADPWIQFGYGMFAGSVLTLVIVVSLVGLVVSVTQKSDEPAEDYNDEAPVTFNQPGAADMRHAYMASRRTWLV